MLDTMALTESHSAPAIVTTEKPAVNMLSPRSSEGTKSGLQDSINEGLLRSPKEMQKSPGTNPTSTPARISSFSISSILSKPSKECRKVTEEKEIRGTGTEKESSSDHERRPSSGDGPERGPTTLFGSPACGHLGVPIHHPFAAFATDLSG